MAGRLPFSRLTFDTAKGSQADQSIMGGAVGIALKPVLAVCVAIAIVTIACIGPLSGKAAARANIQDYLKGPNLFYPRFHDVNGSSTKFVIDTVGWNATRIAGNVGIGDGSVKTFDQTSTFDVEYPENEFMCGDVSTQPWVPGLKTEAPQVEAAAEESATGDVTAERTEPEENVASPAIATGPAIPGNVSRNAPRFTGQDVAGGAENKTGNSAGEDAVNESGRYAPANAALANTEQARAVSENLTYAAFHPIQYLSPVKDVMYEHPLSTSGTAYCELLGFVPPAGPPVNVGMKCTGYGY